ncbi:ShiF [Klebsiella pneumoniae subsp. rhinoscleromatis]|nr:ShiF [Klebsiella pneumoniae subsp. rhinoscleromatis]
MPQKTLSCWPLAFSAGLLGVGQNGLLVAIPVLVIQTNLSLSIWAALLMLGSMLFLPSSPWWGKQIARVGSKPVVLWALGGYGASFTLLGLGSMLMATGAVTTAVGAGNINHRADRLRAYRVSDGTSLSGLGIAESGGKGIAWSLWQPLAPA